MSKRNRFYSIINTAILLASLINPKNASDFYFSGQTQDLSQSLPLKAFIRGQGKDGWIKRSIVF